MRDSRQAINAMMSGNPIRPVVAPMWDGIFCAPILGKEYASDVTLEEQLQVADLCGFDPLVRMDASALWANVPSLQMTSRMEEREGGVRRRFATFSCPAGDIEMISDEPKGTSGTCIKDGTDNPKIYDIIEWYFREILRHRDGMAAEAKKFADKYGAVGSLHVGWLTPVEVFFMAYPNIITMYLDNRERHREMADLNLKVIEAILQACGEADFDFAFSAGPPIELVGHNLYEEMGMHYLLQMRQMASEAGLWFRFHNCGHIKRLLIEGTYNRLLPDLFETLAPPTMGELDDLRWARKQLDPRIVTHGNLDLEFIKNSTPQQVAKRSAEVYEETRGYRHILAGADELLWGTPVENVRAMVEGAMRST